MPLGTLPTSPAGRHAAADETGLRSEIIHNVHAFANSRPRSLQLHVGPSQVGTACARQLTYQVAQHDEARDVHDPWPSIVGTAVHVWLADAMEYANAQALLAGKPQPWHLERKVDVGLGLRGSCDAFHEPTGTVLDWKILGKTQHAKYSEQGPSEKYEVQADCYGLGYVRAGFDVQRVAIAMFQRAGKLSDLHIWSKPYDQTNAIRALARLQTVQRLVAQGVSPQAIPAKPGGDCYFCVAAETEVVTRGGTFPVAELAGSKPELLVPRGSADAERGDFVAVPVRAFGQQRLHRVTLSRGPATKAVHATAEHRWVCDDGSVTTTTELTAGTRLATVRADTVVAEQNRVATAQGFIFGGGTKPQGNRPGTLSVYDRSSKRPMLDYFPGLTQHRMDAAAGDRVTWLYGIDRAWKVLPGLDHDREWLLSWLAGYFAADGSVSTIGQCSISSANRDALVLVRDVAVLCGVRHGVLGSTWRTGYGTEPTELHSIDLNPRDLPAWFFLLDHHAERALARTSKPEREQDRRARWEVCSVEVTDRVETVYCATVPEVEAFALTDGLTTGNCSWQGDPAEGFCTGKKADA